MRDFFTIEDLGNLPPPKWLLHGLFEQDALVMLYGPPGSFKSFLAVDWALSMSVGKEWNGRRTEPSRVLYLLGEGKASLLKRIQAWQFHNKLTPAQTRMLYHNFRVTFQVPQLAIPKDAAEFSDDLDEDGFNPSVIIIDTLARSYVGKNENDPMDTGLWIESVDRLRQRGATVLVLHHTRKNVEFGLQYRGSTAWMGAMDSAYVLEKNPEGFRGFSKLVCSKQKDHEEAEDVWMQTEQIRPPGAVAGSIILKEVQKPGGAEQELKEAEDAALSSIIEMLMADGSYPSDRARARDLASKTNMLETTAQTKIARARKRVPTRAMIEKDVNDA